MSRPPITSRIFDGTAFALASPGAPRGAFPVSLEDRDDGPRDQPHDSFVVVEGLFVSEAKARDAAAQGAQERGKFRRLLVEIELDEALVVDARGGLDAMALRRGEAYALDELARLYEEGVDLARIDGPDGELVLMFTEAIGQTVRIIDEAILMIEQRPQSLSLRDVVLAVAAAFLIDGLKVLINPLVHLSVPLWGVTALVLVILLGPRVVRAVRRLGRQFGQTVRLLQRLADLTEAVDLIETRQAQMRAKDEGDQGSQARR